MSTVRTGTLFGQRYVRVGRMSLWPRLQWFKRCTDSRCSYDNFACPNGCKDKV